MAANDEMIKVDLVDVQIWRTLLALADDSTALAVLSENAEALTALAENAEALTALAEKADELLALLDDEANTEP